MLQLNPPLARVVVGGEGWEGPTGKGVTDLIIEGHRDDDMIWIIDMDPEWADVGTAYRIKLCTGNARNITYGRKLESMQPKRGFPTNGDRHHALG